MQANHVSFEDAEARATPRTNLFLSAMINFDGGSAPVRLRDLSHFGARIEGALLPAVGTVAHITRGALDAAGTTMWREGRGCGLRFSQPLDLDAWIPGRCGRTAILDHDPVDPPDGTCGAPRPGVDLADSLPGRLAEELAYVARMLDSLGDDLAGEPLVVMRHVNKLQNLDISAQILGHVAKIIVARQPEQAIDAIGMGSLRKRLQRTAL